MLPAEAFTLGWLVLLNLGCTVVCFYNLRRQGRTNRTQKTTQEQLDAREAAVAAREQAIREWTPLRSRAHP